MGSLSAPNKIKDIYTKLIFKGDDGNCLLYTSDAADE